MLGYAFVILLGVTVFFSFFKHRILCISAAPIVAFGCILLSVISFSIWIEPQFYHVETRQQLLDFVGMPPLAYSLQILLSVILLWRGITALLWSRGWALWSI